MDEYMYILRFTVQPGHMEKDRIGGLVDFCRDPCPYEEACSRD